MKKKLLFLVLIMSLTPVVVFAESFNIRSYLGLFITVFVMFIIPVALGDQKANGFSDAIVKQVVVVGLVFAIVRIILGNPAVYFLAMILCFAGIGLFFPRAMNLMDVKRRTTQSINDKLANQVSTIKCKKCNSIVFNTDKFCMHCGASLENNTYVESTSVVSAGMFDPIYTLSDDECLEKFVLKEVEKAGIDLKTNLIAEEALRRKKVLILILSALLFVLVSLIFFHFPVYTYVIGLIILLIVFINNSKYSYLKYLKKKVKERPGEKISNIVMLSKESLVKDNSKVFTLIGIIAALVLSLGIFSKPRIIYEKMDGGYGVRFYAFGLTNMKTATIPDEHKGQPVISLRGNAFSNMPYLEEVYLSDNITEIRGQAFLNNKNLKSVKMPAKLKTLGGSAFANCVSIEKIEFGDELEEIGGRAFEGATSLKEVKLSSSLKKIGGGAFRNCTSLESIVIPDGVQELGGSMFEGATSLRGVKLSNTLTEIGGGAFKHCTSLESIVIPDSVVNLGGESFMGDVNLSSVVLSKNLVEIRGDTFSGCTSLKSIDIPDTVTRIGGHAFEDNYSLATVTLTPNSQLLEIGSSAFRRCRALRLITIPSKTTVNQRAFKESPTRVMRFGSND